MKKITLILVLLLSGCSKNTTIVEHKPLSNRESLKIIIATDIHYLSPDLYVQNSYLDSLLENGDGKVIQYSDQILEAFIQDIKAELPDFLIVSGDLTFNGEKKSHEALARGFKEIESNGTEVYVIPGNHDINNPRSRSYSTNASKPSDSISVADFASIYKEFGYKEGESLRHNDSLSYLVKLNESQWMFMLDSNNNTQENQYASSIGGSITQDVMDWMAEIMDTNPSIDFMVTMHHNLYRHSSLINDGFTLDNTRAFIKFLDDYAIRSVFSGHIHIQSIRPKDSDTIPEVVTGSLSVSPNQYGVIELDNNHFSYQTKPLDFTMKDGQNFQNVSKRFFNNTAYRMAEERLSKGTLDEISIQQIAVLFSELNAAYFSGVVVEDKEHYRNSRAYQIIKENGFLLEYMDSILENTNDSTTLILP